MAYPTAEEFAAQRPIKVQCRCGWQGMTDELIGRLASSELHCPRCSAVFEAWPKPPNDR